MGGNATICLGVDDDHVVVDVPPSGRKAPGTEATICLGSEEPFELECHTGGFGGKHVPGGESTICFGASEIQPPPSASKFVHAPGGPTTICFGESTDFSCRPRESGIPPGGKTSICLGMEDEEHDEASEEVRPGRPVGGGRTAPGGATTICLGLAELSPRGPPRRQAPGGNSTICLGEYVDENINTLNSLYRQDLDGKKANKILGEQVPSNETAVCLE